MIKGDPEVGEELYLSYNTNVTAVYAGLDLVTFHDEDFSSDDAICEALRTKCGVDPEEINRDSIKWLQKK